MSPTLLKIQDNYSHLLLEDKRFVFSRNSKRDGLGIGARRWSLQKEYFQEIKIRMDQFSDKFDYVENYMH